MGVRGVNNTQNIKVERILNDDPTQVLKELAKTFLTMVFLGASQGLRDQGIPLSNNYHTNLTGALLQSGLFNGIGNPNQAPVIYVRTNPVERLLAPLFNSVVETSENTEASENNSTASSKQAVSSYVKDSATNLKKAELRLEKAEEGSDEKAVAEKDLAKAKIMAKTLESTKNPDGTNNVPKARKVSSGLISNLDRLDKLNSSLDHLEKRSAKLKAKHRAYNDRSLKFLRSKPKALDHFDEGISKVTGEIAGTLQEIKTTAEENNLGNTDLQGMISAYIPESSGRLSAQIQEALGFEQ